MKNFMDQLSAAIKVVLALSTLLFSLLFVHQCTTAVVWRIALLSLFSYVQLSVLAGSESSYLARTNRSFTHWYKTTDEMECVHGLVYTCTQQQRLVAEYTLFLSHGGTIRTLEPTGNISGEKRETPLKSCPEYRCLYSVEVEGR